MLFGWMKRLLGRKRKASDEEKLDIIRDIEKEVKKLEDQWVEKDVNVNLKMGDYGGREVGKSGGENLPPGWT